MISKSLEAIGLSFSEPKSAKKKKANNPANIKPVDVNNTRFFEWLALRKRNTGKESTVNASIGNKNTNKTTITIYIPRST